VVVVVVVVVSRSRQPPPDAPLVQAAPSAEGASPDLSRFRERYVKINGCWQPKTVGFLDQYSAQLPSNTQYGPFVDEGWTNVEGGMQVSGVPPGYNSCSRWYP
jgi:hypothetical protein